VLGWAEDFDETASYAVATLTRDSRAKHRRAWRLPRAILEQVPEWTAMLDPVCKPASRRR
jgi:hypothetical protein